MPQAQTFDNIKTNSEFSIEQCHINLNLKMFLADQWLLRGGRGGITNGVEETSGG